MKILMLNGQNHKGSTYNIARMIADKIEGENEIVEFFFPRDLNHFCTGCYQCIEDMARCPFYEEKKKIIDAMDASDLIILATPTYCLGMSASLKAFFDLTFDLWMPHRPMKSMFQKRALVVTTSAGSSPKSLFKEVKDKLFYMGVPEVKTYGLAVQAMKWEGVAEKKKAKIQKDVTKLARKLSVKRKPTVGIKTKVMFGLMGMIHKKGWDSSPVEAAYWKKHGWFDGKKPWKAD